jgi:GH35 family endo-1,4-beta-xylanase
MKAIPRLILDRLSGGLLPLLLLASGTVPAMAETPTLKDAYKEHFLFGTAINRSFGTGQGFRRTPEQVAQDIDLVKTQFNQITAENDMKWALIHPRPGDDGYDFGPADAFVEFGLKNKMVIAGHVLVWHSQTPHWVFRAGDAPPPASNDTPPAAPAPAPAPAAPSGAPAADAPPGGQSAAPGAPNAANPERRNRGGFGPGGGRQFTGPKASREELLGRMRSHIHTVVGRYKGKIKTWDVVNEALADGGPDDLRKSLWLEIIGPDFIAKAFEYAHEADPDAILRYNDYGLENPVKRRKLISLVKSLQEKKVPIHAIGTQAHVNLGTSFEIMDQALTEMAALGLPIHVTELDVNTAEGGQRGTGADIAGNASTTEGGLVSEADRKQAEVYAGLFRAFLKHGKSVEMVTLWGSNDALSWRRQGRPLLFDGENKPKPAFDAVIRAATGNTK